MTGWAIRTASTPAPCSPPNNASALTDDRPPDGGLWTGRLVAQWICGLLGRLVSPRRGVEYLRRLGFTRQVPRPRHARGDFAVQERFKADFRARMEELAREEPGRSVEVWAFDEHRAGLKPVIRKVWARRGQRPLARGHQRFQWVGERESRVQRPH